MTLELLSFILGAILFAVGVLGGGIEVKEIKIPKVTRLVRILSASIGLVFILLGLWIAEIIPRDKGRKPPWPDLISDETNNQKTDDYRAVRPVPPKLPDLIIESLTHSPETPTTADTITFTAAVKNIGGGKAGHSTLALKVGGETVPKTYPVPATVQVHPGFERQTISPEGGTLQYTNGVSITFAQGAVTEDTVIGIRPVHGTDLEWLFGEQLSDFDDVKVRGGFVGEASPSQFNGPVAVTIPVLPMIDTGSQLLHALADQDRKTLHITGLPLNHSSTENTVSLTLPSFSSQLILEYSMYLDLTTPDKHLKLEFFEGLYAAYVHGNHKEENFQDFEDGFQKALQYLQSKLGTAYDDDHVFCAFDLTMVSHVSMVRPNTNQINKSKTSSTGLSSCGPDVERLHPDRPWLNAPVLHRSYTNTRISPEIEVEEVFDLAVVAYIRPRHVQLSIGWIEMELDIFDGRSVGDAWVVTSRDFSEDPVNKPIPMPRLFEHRVEGTFRGGSGDVNVRLQRRDDFLGFTLTSSGFGQKEDGRYFYLTSWLPNPHAGVKSFLDVYIIMTIDNPSEREITLGIEHQGRSIGPQALGGPWQQQSLSLVQYPVSASEGDVEFSDLVYGAYGDDATSHSGVKKYRFRDKTIHLGLFFEPHNIRATEFLKNQLDYTIRCTSEVKVSISGLYD